MSLILSDRYVTESNWKNPRTKTDLKKYRPKSILPNHPPSPPHSPPAPPSIHACPCATAWRAACARSRGKGTCSISAATNSAATSPSETLPGWRGYSKIILNRSRTRYETGGSLWSPWDGVWVHQSRETGSPLRKRDLLQRIPKGAWKKLLSQTRSNCCFDVASFAGRTSTNSGETRMNPCGH